MERDGALQLPETQLLRVDRLVTLGLLSAGVAHEVNNPLAYVLSNVDYLREVMGSGVQAPSAQQVAEWRQVLGEVREGAERVRQIVAQLRGYTRVEEGEGPVEVARVLDSVAAMAASMVRPRARLVKEYGTSRRVHGSEGSLFQVFLNLVINAAQAIPEGHAERNEIRLVTREDESGRVVVEVRDSGEGIPPENLPRIFEPFFTTKAVGVGTGLGLAICQSLVRSLKGEISVESTVGVGTTFRVVLQPEQGVEVAAQAPRPEPVPPRVRALVIDDEPAVAVALGRLLQGQVNAVDVAHGGDQGLKLLGSGAGYDVVLCDLLMPGMTGMDVYEEAVARNPELRERFLFVTGGGATARAQAFIEREAHRVLDKPFTRREVQQRVAQVLAEATRGSSRH